MRENQLSRYGAIARNIPFTTGKVFFVVASGDDVFADFSNAFPVDGDGVLRVHSTIQAAIDAAAVEADPSAGHVILVKPSEMAAGATDPTSFGETLIIAAAQANLSIVGMTEGNAQGRLPQVKKGSGSTALLTIRAPGCLIKNMGFNGAGSTGGGILLDDDASTKSAFGTVIEDCHFKNCKGSTATNAATGGAIQWAATGGAWQVVIRRNRFYKNVGDIVLLGTSSSVPQDVVIEDNIFSGPAASVDCNLYLRGGSGMNGVIIRNNCFTALPAIGSGTNAQFLALTGCVGMLADNTFAVQTAEGGSERTFGAAGNELVPTTVFMARNYGEFATGVGAGLISGEIFRT